MNSKQIETFKNPGSDYRGAPFWAWNGKIEPEELRRLAASQKAETNVKQRRAQMAVRLAMGLAILNALGGCASNMAVVHLNIEGVRDRLKHGAGAEPGGAGGFVAVNGWRKITVSRAGVRDPLTLRLTWDSTHIAVYSATNNGTVLTSPTVWTSRADMPAALWVKGLTASSNGPVATACGPEQLTLEAIRDGISLATDRIGLTVGYADLGVDSNNDGVMDGADDAIEETEPGMLILSDEGSKGLRKLVLQACPAPKDGAQVHLSQAGNGKIRVFFRESIGSVVALEAEAARSADLARFFTHTNLTLWIEGVTNGQVTLAMETFYGAASNAASFTDKVIVNVLRIQMVRAGQDGAYPAVRGTRTELASVLDGEASSHTMKPLPPPEPPADPVAPYTDRPWVHKITMGGEERYEISAHLRAAVIRIHGANFADGCKVACSNGLIAVTGVTRVSSNVLDVAVSTDTDVFGLTTLQVTNPDGMACSAWIWVRVGALYDAHADGGPPKGGREAFGVVAKTATNRIGYLDCAGIRAFINGTNTLTGDGHTSSRPHTLLAVALSNGTSYQVQLYLGSPTNATGPSTVKINGQVVASGMTATGGAVRVVGATVAPSNGLVIVSFDGKRGTSWSLYGLRIHAVDGEAFTDLRHDNYTQAFRFYDFEGADGLTMTGFVRVLPAVKTAGLPVGYQDAAGIESYSGGPAGQLSADGHRSARPATRLIADVPTNGRYWARLSLFDPRENIGPVSVWMNGLCVARNVRERRGKVREILSEAVTVTAGRVEIDLVNGGNSVWGVCGLEMGEEWPTNMPSNWVAGQPTTLAIGVKAGEFDLSGGAIRITVPDGLPAPTVDNPGAAGYVRALCPDGVTVSGIRVSGREITLTMGAFAAGRLVEVLFGDRSGGGPGAVAGAVGDYSFAVRVSGAGGSLLPAMAPGQDPATATGAASGYCREAGGPNTEEWPGYQLHDNDPREIPFACPEPYFPLTTVGDDCRFRMMVIGEECALASLLNVKVYCEKRDGTPWEAKAFDLMTTGQPGQRVTSKKIIVHDGAVKEATKRYFEEQGYELLLGDGGDPITTRVYRRSLD